MSEKNKISLRNANAEIAKGNIEGFLSFCADDIKWTTVGENTLEGKEAVREWMAKAYVESPKFAVANLIAEGDFVAALGDIAVKDKNEKLTQNAYCDLWRFHDGKMAELRAFVIKSENQ